MTKKEIEMMQSLRFTLLQMCMTAKTCKNCPLLIRGSECAAVFLAASLAYNVVNHD